MKANLETGPRMPSRGHGWWLHFRARKSTGWPVVLLTPSPGPPASPPTPGNCLHRYCTGSKRKEKKVSFFCILENEFCPRVPVDGSKALQAETSSKQSRSQTFKSCSCRQPDCLCGVLKVPMEYNHLQEIPIMALRNRLLLLHHISELFCPCIPMFDLEGRLGQTGHGPSVGFDTLRGILISQGKVRYCRMNLNQGEKIQNGNSCVYSQNSTV